MIKTSRYKGLFWVRFLAPEIDIIFGDGVGASLVILEEDRAKARENTSA
jgi:hypothetical protein